MTSAGTAAPAQAHPARQKAIQPYLDKLAAWCRSPAGRQDLDRIARINIGSRQLVLEPWERAQLAAFFDGVAEGVPATLTHGIALIVKGTLDVERLRKESESPTAELYALQAELMLDAAIGMALLHETDHAITREVQAGGVEQAKPLSTFRHKLSRMVTESKQHIADSERQQAEALAGSMTDQPFLADPEPEPEPAPVEGPAEPPPPVTAIDPELKSLLDEAAAAEEIQPIPTVRRRRRPPVRREEAPAVRMPTRTEVLAVATAVLLLVWAGVTQVPTMFEHEMTRIERAQIDVVGDLNVDARPPSLFVTIPDGVWEAMSEDDREALVDSIAQAAVLYGYSGARLATDSGRPVARWLQARGSERIPPGESEAVQTAP